MLQIGKTALARGLALDHYAFPTIGIPQHTQIGPEIERSIIYSVARTESAFDQRDKSAANAVGLMQVTPEAGRDTAKRFERQPTTGTGWSPIPSTTREVSAELSALLSEYKGLPHHGVCRLQRRPRPRARVDPKAHGDPRDPNVDPVDWVERIPLPKHAITCSASWRTCWSTACVLTTAPRWRRRASNAW